MLNNHCLSMSFSDGKVWCPRLQEFLWRHGSKYSGRELPKGLERIRFVASMWLMVSPMKGQEWVYLSRPFVALEEAEKKAERLCLWDRLSVNTSSGRMKDKRRFGKKTMSSHELLEWKQFWEIQKTLIEEKR